MKRWYEDKDYYNGTRKNDEYYTVECDHCEKETERDVCTDKCVECGF